MDAEDKELLRDWLVRSLEPVCDADPEVLSKYVLALVQNNPGEDGLEATCVSKLDEFLGDETKPFVSRLFKALATGSYKAEEVARGAREYDDNMDDERGRSNGDHRGSNSRSSDDSSSRRRPRTPSDDEDERRRLSKRRRDEDRAPRSDSRRHPGSPRRDSGGRQRQQYGPRDGMGGGAMGGRNGPGFMGGDRRRNFPEWPMPPQHMGGMWPPHFPPQGAGYPMPPDFDPSVYNPENPSMGPPPMGMMMPPMGGRGQYFPPNGGRGGRGRGRGGSFYPGRGSNGGEPGANGEPGPAGDAANGYGQPPMAKTTLRVSNVDPKYVNMTKLSLHFSKFGNVVNVQMRPTFKCAFVQYATEEEAKKAFHSPIPVCNNRFIEVKWARYDAKDPQGAPTVAEQSAESKEGVDDAASSDAKTPTSASADSTATPGEPTEPVKELTPEELRTAALEKGRKVLEEKRELLEKQRQLKKQKEELIKRQLAQQKEMLERMSRNSGQFSAADKRDLLNKITALSEELKSLASTQRTGDKITGLKAELSALEAEASAGPGRGVPGYRGGRGFRGGRGGRGGRGARGSFGHHSNTLDNRTTIVKVENLPEAARDPIVLEQHFGNFGAVERVVLDQTSPTQGYIKFHDRYGGQAALTHGKVFGESSLELGWVEAQEAPAELASANSTPRTGSAATTPTTDTVAALNDANEVPTHA